MDYEQDYSKTAWADSIWYYISRQFRRNFAAESGNDATADGTDPVHPEVISLDSEDFK